MIETSRDHRAWTVTLRNESHRNALTVAMTEELATAITAFEADDTARVLLLRGAGAASFCSGADVKELAALAREGRPFRPVLPAVYEQLLTCSKPTVAALNGDAVGGGLELALACDFALAREGVRIGLPEINLATVARYGIALIARLAGRGTALRLGLLGDLHPIEEVPELVSAIVPAAELDGRAADLARRLADRPGAAVRAVKEIALRATELTLWELAQLPSVLAAVHGADRQAAFAVRDVGPARPVGNAR